MENEITIIQEEILTAQQVADILGVSKKVIERELREEKMKGSKRLGKWFVLKSDLVTYIKKGE